MLPKRRLTMIKYRYLPQAGSIVKLTITVTRKLERGNDQQSLAGPASINNAWVAAPRATIIH
jgi:hypothetical protein